MLLRGGMDGTVVWGGLCFQYPMQWILKNQVFQNQFMNTQNH